MSDVVTVVIPVGAKVLGSTTSFFKVGLYLNTNCWTSLGVMCNLTSSPSCTPCARLVSTLADTFLAIPVRLSFTCANV